MKGDRMNSNRWMGSALALGLVLCAANTPAWASGPQRTFSAQVEQTIPDEDGFIRMDFDMPAPAGMLLMTYVTRPDGSMYQMPTNWPVNTSAFRIDCNMPGRYSFLAVYGFFWNNVFQWAAWSTNDACAYIGESSIAFDDFDGHGAAWFWWDSDWTTVYKRCISEVSYEGLPFFEKNQRHSMRVAYDKRDKPWSFFAAYPADRTLFADFDALSMQVRGAVTMAVKLVDSGGRSWETQVATVTGDPNDWETLRVDYRGAASRLDLESIENVLFFVAPGQTWTKGTFYLDNIAFDRLLQPLPSSPTVDPLPLRVDKPPCGDADIWVTGRAAPGQLVSVWLGKPEYGPCGMQWLQPFFAPQEVQPDATGRFTARVNLLDAPKYFNVWATAKNPDSPYNSLRSDEQDILYGTMNLLAPKLDALPEETSANAVIVRGVAEPNSIVVPAVEIPGMGRWDQPAVVADEGGLFEATAWIFGPSGQSFTIFAYFIDPWGNYSGESERQTVVLSY